MLIVKAEVCFLLNSEDKKKSLMGFIYRVLWILRAIYMNCFVWNHQYYEKFAKNKIGGRGAEKCLKYVPLCD